MIVPAILVIGLLVTACARPDYSELWPDHFTVSGGSQPGYAIKRVIEKLEPATLVGDDGSVCHTSTHRFDKSRVGSWIDCNWALPSIDTPELAQVGP
jgi:hypothetical protein